MCGIAGILSLNPDSALDVSLSKMVDTQSHRGPDGQGCWFGRVGRTGVALASVRLAIQDLTVAGHQPMMSPSGRQVLVYNGEVYNYLELRRDLEGLGIEFHSRCDTEVVFQALRAWGQGAFEGFKAVEATIRKDYDTVTLPTMSTGATDMAYLRAKGMQCYGIGPAIDIEDGPKGFGAHSDQERILESELYRFVRFHYDVVAELARAK